MKCWPREIGFAGRRDWHTSHCGRRVRSVLRLQASPAPMANRKKPQGRFPVQQQLAIFDPRSSGGRFRTNKFGSDSVRHRL